MIALADNDLVGILAIIACAFVFSWAWIYFNYTGLDERVANAFARHRELASRLDKHDTRIMHLSERVEESAEEYNKTFDRIRDAIYDEEDDE